MTWYCWYNYICLAYWDVWCGILSIFLDDNHKSNECTVNSIDAVLESVHADAAAREHGTWLLYESIYFEMIEIYTKYFCLLSGTTQEVQDERQETTDMEADRELQ